MVGLSEVEKLFIRGGIAQDLRVDGRRRLQFRAVSVETGVISQANGSVRVRLGVTEVIVSVKITPAHDPNDFEVGKRHNLEFINIFTDDGKINSNGGAQFEGMPRFTARVAVIEALKEKPHTSGSAIGVGTRMIH